MSYSNKTQLIQKVLISQVIRIILEFTCLIYFICILVSINAYIHCSIHILFLSIYLLSISQDGATYNLKHGETRAYIYYQLLAYS